MIQPQARNLKNFKEGLFIGMAIFLLLIIFDYSFSSHLLETTRLYHFRKTAIIIRAFYFFLFGVLCYYSAKGTASNKKNLVIENGTKIALFIVTLFCVAGLLFIDYLSFKIILYAYPTLFLVANFTEGFLILNYINSQEKTDDNTTNLGVEDYISDRQLTITLAAQGGYINIINPARSVMVIGGAGAGKSASVAEPVIIKSIGKKYTGFVYDFKFPTLADVVYSSFQYHQEKQIKFYPISFTELDKSYRFNPLDPFYLETQTHVEEYSWALYSNLDREAIKKGGFFPESAAGLLKAVIWFMKRKHPEYCTLPHVLNIILNASDKDLIAMIISDEQTKGMMKSVKEAAEKKATDQLAGVLGSLTMQLQKINTPEINWVLSGNDFTIDLNNKNDPKFIVLGSNPTVRTALSPIIAFTSTVLLKVMNQQGKQQSMALIDEGPTVYIPNLDEIPATARSNKLAIYYMAQDFSQMDAMYGKDKRMALVSNLAYQFYGNISGLETAEYVSRMFGKEYRIIQSTNTGTSNSDGGESKSQGASYSEQQREILKANEMFSLPVGTFVGKLVETKNEWFKARLKRVGDEYPDYRLKNIPSFVMDFVLTGEDLKRIESDLKEIKEDILKDNGKSKLPLQTPEILNVQNQFNAKNINIDDYLGELMTIIKKERLKEKKQQVLERNFKRIQDEAESIVKLYH